MAVGMLATLMSALVGWTRRDDEGQTMAEYGLILAGIAIIVVAAIAVLGPAIATLLENVAAEL